MRLVHPIAVASQVLRHVTTLSPERLAETTPFNELAKLDIYLPNSIAELIELLGQVNTNAGKFTLVGPRSGLR